LRLSQKTQSTRTPPGYLMPWQRTSIAGNPADLFEPENARPFALLWLHDESGVTPATDPAFTAELEARRLRCVAPHGARSWWVDLVCPEFDLVLTAERHLLDNVLPSLGTNLIAVAGVGMGGQGALRFGFRYPARFPVVASLDGAFDFHDRHGRGTPLDTMYASREQSRQDTAVLHIHGHDWPPHIYFACGPESEWQRGNDRLHEKLTAIGVPHTADLDTSGDLKTLLDFVTTALERESRRLA
jgi:pimeloyl-ACP methyl ester carboxylesterase